MMLFPVPFRQFQNPLRREDLPKILLLAQQLIGPPHDGMQFIYRSTVIQ